MVAMNEDRVTNMIVFVLLSCLGIIAIFPLLYVVVVSITPYTEVIKHGGYVIIPRSVTFGAYQKLLTNSELPRAFAVTAFVTAVGTLIAVSGITSMAYPLSRKTLPGRNLILLYILFTMLFGGGMIPTYLIVKATGLLNTVWAMIIPGAISTFHILVMKSFFENLPQELFESARIDGARELRILLQIVIPLSIPVIMTIALFNMVVFWNVFMPAVLYISDRALNPLQIVLRGILTSGSMSTEVTNVESVVPTVTMQMAAVVLVSTPMIVIYPFIQKYFTKGMLIGSIKG